MEAYKMKSDKTFIRCMDTGAIEVYELDNPYMFPVKGKHWSHLGISIGPGNKYEALTIGDKDIRGDDLQKLIKDLFNWRLIVNREGLGFLPTGGLAVVVLEVEYYRLFDIFDWSKYKVKTSLNTKWARSDFMDGRPLNILGCNSGNENHNDGLKEKLEKKEKELEEEKHKHIGELKEVERKKKQELKGKEDEIDKLKGTLERIKQENVKKNEEDIAELKGKHEEELKEVESKKEVELKEKQNEINNMESKHKEELAKEESKNKDELKNKDNEIWELKRKQRDINEGEKKKVEDLEKQIKLYKYDNSIGATDYFLRILQMAQVTVPSSKFNVRRSESITSYWPPTGKPDMLTPLGPVQSMPEREIVFQSPYTGNDFDLNNWRAVRVAYPLYTKKFDRFDAFLFELYYYDGNRYQAEAKYTKNVVIPSPCPAVYLNKVSIRVRFILGIGFRMTI